MTREDTRTLPECLDWPRHFHLGLPGIHFKKIEHSRRIKDPTSKTNRMNELGGNSFQIYFKKFQKCYLKLKSQNKQEHRQINSVKCLG